MSTDPVQLRTKSPLLFGTCILAGLHITPSLYGSSTHQALYRHIHGLLGQAHLSSTASLDTIQSMLIFSMWDLRPTLGPDHGTSWLLSGTAAMRVIMTTSFGQLPKTSDADRSERARAQEIMRTWNLICLCQLQCVTMTKSRSFQCLYHLTLILDFPWALVVHRLYPASTLTNVPTFSIFRHTMHATSLYWLESGYTDSFGKS